MPTDYTHKAMQNPVIAIKDNTLKARVVRLGNCGDRTVAYIARQLLEPAVAAAEIKNGMVPIQEDPEYAPYLSKATEG